MATNKESAVKEAADPIQEAAVKTTMETESVYTSAELIANHRAFQTSREIVNVALRLSGAKTATFQEAKAIIEKFKNKEVK